MCGVHKCFREVLIMLLRSIKLAKHWLIEQDRNAMMGIHLPHLKASKHTHDAAVHEYSIGLSRVEVARNHGIVFTIAPDIALIEGIDAVRNILNRCWFDEVKCTNDIKALENYKKEWMNGMVVGQVILFIILQAMVQTPLEYSL